MYQLIYIICSIINIPHVLIYVTVHMAVATIKSVRYVNILTTSTKDDFQKWIKELFLSKNDKSIQQS
ncbi:hypothetical protein RhiirA1_17979 [Rhizophagus irregularis]|uniref:Uncharacterized protein n=1 Tax=Rhizophagus irregularis TaxID=588596 RepID=A0A2N0RB94_9GLOM|nr:hypothetical protein RhiirA1_17979 [Rhizophagus irregularis]GET63022.1 hypothetical protein RIR_jg36711.t1 [Rhizophagus irregularis DAOM 181602=DAOM 197198]